jgi:hypothetical protein
MTRLSWDQVGERLFETGLDRGVLYPPTGDGVPWNGLVSVSENPSGGESKPFYLDGYKYQNRSSPSDFEATIEAYTYPDEFATCMGMKYLGSGLYMGNQRRTQFGLSYRTKIGNDLVGDTKGHKIHLVYNALAAPTSQNYGTVGENPQPINFSWNLTTKPVKVSGYKATPTMVIDTTKLTAPLLASLESIIYGSSSAAPRLPTPTELITLFIGWPTLLVTDNGDGTFTVSGPDSLVRLIDLNTFQINGETVTDNGNGTFTVTSF